MREITPIHPNPQPDWLLKINQEMVGQGPKAFLAEILSNHLAYPMLELGRDSRQPVADLFGGAVYSYLYYYPFPKEIRIPQPGDRTPSYISRLDRVIAINSFKTSDLFDMPDVSKLPQHCREHREIDGQSHWLICEKSITGQPCVRYSALLIDEYPTLGFIGMYSCCQAPTYLVLHGRMGWMDAGHTSSAYLDFGITPPDVVLTRNRYSLSGLYNFGVPYDRVGCVEYGDNELQSAGPGALYRRTM